MAFRKKAGFILTHQPDILIVPECEHPDRLKFTEGTPLPTSVLWYGENQNKGLGVFSYGKYKLKLLKNHNPDFKTILPIAVTGGATNFTLFAIWAYNPLDKDYHYIGQVWKAIHFYERILKKKKVILTGDFNSNVIWDRLNRKSNHTMVVEKLEALKIHSTYHTHLKQIPGQETDPTFFLYRHEDKPYHLDYCFASADLLSTITDVQVGKYKEWRQHSDHKPLIITFNI